MSIASEITRISGNIADAYTACNDKGATMPATENSDNLATTIASISAGGGSSSYEDFDRDAFLSKVNEMDSILAVRSGEYNSGRMERLLQNGFVQKKASSSNYDAQWFYILQLTYETKSITFKQAQNDSIGEAVAFWCPSECNVYTSDGLGRTTNDSDSTNHTTTIEFTGDEDRTVIIGLGAVTSYNLLLSLYDSFILNDSSIPDVKANIRACHVYLPYFEKYQAASSSTYGDILNYNFFNDVLGCAKMFSFEKPTNTWNKCSSIVTDDLKNFENSLEDTSIFAEIYSSTVFDSDLGVFELPSDRLSHLTGNMARYTQIYSYGSNNGLFPFKIDFSTYSSSSKISFGGYTQLLSYASMATKEVTAYIKLPSAANVNMCVWDGRNASVLYSPKLTFKSWQYLANNAPNVSGKTLNIGKEFYKLAKTLQIPSYKAITDALETKGWTINE